MWHRPLLSDAAIAPLWRFPIRLGLAKPLQAVTTSLIVFILLVGKALGVTTYTIGGTLSGLDKGDSVTLEDNGKNALKLSRDGSFKFTTALVSGASYKVTVSKPAVGETCALTKAVGKVGKADIKSVDVICKSNTYAIGGTVSGLDKNSSVVLEDNAKNALKLSADKKFTFTIKVAYDAAYKVTVSAQPTGQTCSVTHGSGKVPAADVTNIDVVCVPRNYSIGGAISGITSGQVTLLNNGGDPVTQGNGTLTFSTKLANGAGYKVTVSTPPANETCTVAGGSNGDGSGTVMAADVTSIAVACSKSGVGSSSFWIPYISNTPGAQPATVMPQGAQPTVGLFLIASNQLESNPAPTWITTTATELLGVSEQYTTITNNVITNYSPVYAEYYSTGTGGATQIYSVKLSDTSTSPTPTAIGAPIPATEQICDHSEGDTDLSDPSSGFTILKIGPAGSGVCSGTGPFTFAVQKYTDSASTPAAVVNIDTDSFTPLYHDNNLAGLILLDSSGNLNIYADISFTSPKHLLTGLQSANLVLQTVIKDATPFGSSVAYMNLTTIGTTNNPSGTTSFYRIDDTSGGTATLVYNGEADSLVSDDNNVYFIDDSAFTVVNFYQAPISSGMAKFLYSGIGSFNTVSSYIYDYTLIGSNDSILVFQVSSSSNRYPGETETTILTVPVGSGGTASPTAITGTYTGEVSAFLAPPKPDDLADAVLFVDIVDVTAQTTSSGTTQTYNFSSFEGSPAAPITSTPLNNSIYEPFGILAYQTTTSIFQVQGITSTDGSWGGGNFYQVDVGTLETAELKTTGGAAYEIPGGYLGALDAVFSPDIPVGVLQPSAASSGTTATPWLGLAADLTSDFVLQIGIPGENVSY